MCQLCNLFVYSNAQALSIGDIVEAAGQGERDRISEAPKLAPRLIPQASIQSQLGAYLIDQLYIQLGAEKNKQKGEFW